MGTTTQHWSHKYIGLPYSQHDCAELAVRVQREQFGRTIKLPTTRATGLHGISQQIDDLRADFAVPVLSPEDGDAVLMIGRGQLNHIGVYCEVGGEPYVLHAMRNAGQTCMHRLRNLGGIGLTVEGFYRWI